MGLAEYYELSSDDGRPTGGERQPVIEVPKIYKQHDASCSFLRTGVTCCLPTFAQGFSASVAEVAVDGIFLDILGAPWSLVHMGGTSFASLPFHVSRAGVTKMCLRWRRPLGGGRWGHSPYDPGGVHWDAPKTAGYFVERVVFL